MLFFPRKTNAKTNIPSADIRIGEILVKVRRHASARRLSLRVNNSREATLTAPPRFPMRDIQRFLESQKSWLENAARRVDGAKQPFEPGVTLLIGGQPVALAHDPAAGGAVLRGGVLVIGGALEHFPRRVSDYLKNHARDVLSVRTRVHADSLGVTVRQVSVRDTRSRWGSCSARGGISYSWRLILAPPNVLDYVAAHEVAHLLEMNHSPRFWAIVARLDPAFEQARQWLKTHGPSLHHYG